MKTQENSAIRKLKWTYPWIVYYLIGGADFLYNTYYQILTMVPYGIITNPHFILVLFSMYVIFAISVQCPPSIIIHTRQVHMSLIKKLLATVFFTDVIALVVITQVCTTKKYITTLILATILIQLFIYSKYIMKIVIPGLYRPPIENYIGIFTHLDRTPILYLGFFYFHLYFHLLLFLLVIGFVGGCILSSLPISNTSIVPFIFKILYCYWGFYSFLYVIISISVISFYLNINSDCGPKESFKIIAKVSMGNIGVSFYMGFIRTLSILKGPLMIKKYMGRYINKKIDEIGDKYFRNIVLYNKIGIKGIVAASSLLELEPYETVEYLQRIEEPGTYPYMSSFSAADSEKTTGRIACSLNIVVLIPLSVILIFGWLFTEEFAGYYKVVIILMSSIYPVSNIGYVYSEAMHYTVVLSNIQGNMRGYKWIDGYLNVI